MPSATTTYTDIGREQRVCHQRHGRGVVKSIDWAAVQGSVLFDDDAGKVTGNLAGKVERTVWLRDLTPLPADMPAAVASEPRPFFRMIWPPRGALDQVAGEGEI